MPDGQEPVRSGDRPLTVWVVRVSGAGQDDLVVSRRTAQRIREAAARDGFLSRWAVGILLSAYQATDRQDSLRSASNFQASV